MDRHHSLKSKLDKREIRVEKEILLSRLVLLPGSKNEGCVIFRV